MSDKSLTEAGSSSSPECDHGNLETCNACQMDWILRVKQLDALVANLAKLQEQQCGLEALVYEVGEEVRTLRRILEDGLSSVYARLPEPPRHNRYY